MKNAFKARHRCVLMASLWLLPFAASTPAIADTVNGTGRAVITKDAESVRTAAAAEARRSLVRAMLSSAIGRDRLGEVSPDVIADLANQIRSDMITGQTAAREGNQFIVTITAEIDQAWFRGLLADANIDSSSQRADGNRQLILVYLDRADGTASDLAAPAEATIAYDRRTGGSFSDHSTLTASSREAAAASSRSASASSRSAAGASNSRASGGWSERGSAGGFSGRSSSGYANRSSSAAVSRSSSAYAASASLAERTAVDAEVHDDVTFRSHVVYQQPPKDADGDGIMRGLGGALQNYDVSVANSWMAMSAYFPAGVPRYEDLKRSPSFGGFLQSLRARNTPYFLGGTFRITQSGLDAASGQSLCSGVLDAGANASEDGRGIADGVFSETALGISPEDCSGRLTRKLADAAGRELGPKIQNHWRQKARQNVGQDSRQLAEYTLVLRAPKLDMALQQDLMDALSATPGAEVRSFVSQSATELRLTVGYAGATPLQFAVFQQLRLKPSLAGVQSVVDGRSVLLCLSACSVAR